MGRPSVTAERANEILDAFEACVAKHGLEGTTLQRVADTAGLTRSLIRHHVGNRDALLAAWVERAIARYNDELALLLRSLPTSNRAQVLAASLFGGERTEPDRVMDLVVATATDHEEARERISRFFEEMIQAIADDLAVSYPGASPEACLEVASGLAALSMTSESLEPLAVDVRFSAALESAAQRLVATLDPSESA